MINYKIKLLNKKACFPQAFFLYYNKIKVMGRGRPSKKTTSFVRTGRPKSEKNIVCVVYKKGKKHFLNTYQNYELDSIITTRKHTPLIPDDHEILDIGIGKSFIKRYMKEYKIEKITIKD